VPARVETVVLFLPDVWSCSPTHLEWRSTVARFQSELDKKLASSATDDDAGHAESKASNALLSSRCRNLQCVWCVLVAALFSSQQFLIQMETDVLFIFYKFHIVRKRTLSLQVTQFVLVC